MKKWNCAYPVIQEGVAADVMGWQALPDYETVFGKLRGMGYDGIELLVRDFRTADSGRIKKALKKHDLKLCTVGTSPMQKMDGVFLLHKDAAIRAEAERQVMKQLAFCSEFGACASIGLIRGNIMEEPGCMQQDFDRVMHRIGQEAERLGVTVVVEAQSALNLNHLNTIDETLGWLGAMQETHFHLHADTFHMAITEESVSDSLRKAGALSNGGEIGFLHISDTKRLVPGKGELNFDEIFEVLDEISYDGFISPEILQNPGPETCAEECIAFMRKYS